MRDITSKIDLFQLIKIDLRYKWLIMRSYEGYHGRKSLTFEIAESWLIQLFEAYTTCREVVQYLNSYKRYIYITSLKDPKYATEPPHEIVVSKKVSIKADDEFV